MKIWKSILAIVAGIVVSVVLSVGTDLILASLHVFPPTSTGVYVTWMLAVAFFYRSLYGVLGAYTTAALAPAKPMNHATILGFLGLLVNIVGAITMWDKGAHWYPLLLVITALPVAWSGGRIFIGRIKSKSVTQSAH